MGHVVGADSLKLALELDGTGEPIAGCLRHQDGSTQNFVGWLELTQALEAARHRPAGRAPTAAADAHEVATRASPRDASDLAPE